MMWHFYFGHFLLSSIWEAAKYCVHRPQCSSGERLVGWGGEYSAQRTTHCRRRGQDFRRTTKVDNQPHLLNHWVEFIPTLTTRLDIYIHSIFPKWIIIKVVCINIRFVVYRSYFIALSRHGFCFFKLPVAFRDSLVQRLVWLALLISMG